MSVDWCCEACVYRTGQHAPFCDVVFATCAMRGWCQHYELLFHQADRVPLAVCAGCGGVWLLRCSDPVTIAFVAYRWDDGLSARTGF
jgi:hypothetical protein